MGKRRRSRELALQYLYQWDFHGSDHEEPVRLFWEARQEPDKVMGFARQIVEGVRLRQSEIDPLIESQSRRWKMYRMSRIDRNILRIAVFELICCHDIPPKASIDEAIELGKKFGAQDSSAFINGILDQLGRRLGRIGESAGAEKDADNESPGDLDTG